MAATWRKLKKYFSSAENYSSSTSVESSLSRCLLRSSSTLSSPQSTLQSSTSENICTICLNSLERGQGHAIFVAECSHQFHFHCISGNVKYGNISCPVCRTKWNNLPSQAPIAIDSSDNIHRTALNRLSSVNVRRIRDEPPNSISPSQKLTVRSFLHYPAVSASESLSELAILIRVCAPAIDNVHHRIPFDVVTAIQDATVHIQSATSGVQIKSIASRKYKSEIIRSGHEARIDIGDLYDKEEKDFVIYVSVPVFSRVANGGKVQTTSLIGITSSYKDSTSMSMVEVKGKTVEICRPPVAPCKDHSFSLEVDRHINRMLVVKAIEDARRLVKTGDIVGAQSLLAKEGRRLICSASAKVGDSECNKLRNQLGEIKDRMKESYHSNERAALLGTSSQSLQRPTTIGVSVSSQSLQRAATTSVSATFPVPTHKNGGKTKFPVFLPHS